MGYVFLDYIEEEGRNIREEIRNIVDEASRNASFRTLFATDFDSQVEKLEAIMSPECEAYIAFLTEASFSNPQYCTRLKTLINQEHIQFSATVFLSTVSNDSKNGIYRMIYDTVAVRENTSRFGGNLNNLGTMLYKAIEGTDTGEPIRSWKIGSHSYYICDEALDARYERLTEISNIQNLVNLRRIDLSGNKISDLSPLSFCSNLAWLDLCMNQIESLAPLRNLVEITHLTIHSNFISDLKPLAAMHKMKSLSIGGNKITDLSVLANMPNLEKLLFGDNKANVDESYVEILATLPNLRRLVLSGVVDPTPLLALTKLEELDLFPSAATLKFDSAKARKDFIDKMKKKGVKLEIPS